MHPVMINSCYDYDDDVFIAAFLNLGFILKLILYPLLKTNIYNDCTYYTGIQNLHVIVNENYYTHRHTVHTHVSLILYFELTENILTYNNNSNQCVQMYSKF